MSINNTIKCNPFTFPCGIIFILMYKKKDIFLNRNSIIASQLNLRYCIFIHLHLY